MRTKNCRVRILTTPHSIRREIVSLMSPGCKRRIAIAAFVGEGARAFIRDPSGVQIICWPKAGGTNPHELRKLEQAGAQIWFVDSLHMKIYWAQGRKTIITSANLSTNALGSGDLKEIAVVLPHNVIDIDSIISYLKPRRFNKADMDKLEEAHRKLPPRLRPRKTKEDKLKYLDWYALPARAEWRLGWWDDEGRLATRAIEILQRDYGKNTAEDFIGCRKKDFKESDCVLTFRLTKRDTSISSLDWMYVDRIVPVNRSDKGAYYKDYPYQAIQAWTARHYSPPAFIITTSFGEAFREAILDYGVKKIRNLRSTRPPRKLLDMIEQRLKSDI